MSVDLSIDAIKTKEKITTFIKKTVEGAGYKSVVIGLSGGIDSAVSAALAVQALGKNNVHVALLPFGGLNEEGKKDGLLIADHLSISQKNRYIIDISPAVKTTLSSTKESDQLRSGNIAVRMRMIFLYDLSKKIPALVLGTENKTEHLLGYFTRFGDEASDIEPIRSLYKTQVRLLAHFLGIPQRIIMKSPTAGMWEGQTDEKEFGFTYEQADKILSFYIDEKMKEEDIEKKGFQKNVIEKVIARVRQNEFKRHLPHVFE